MSPGAETAFLAVVILGMLLGLFSLLLVFVPGVIIIWLSILAYGLVTGFNLARGIIFGVITLLMLASTIIDNVIMGATTRQQGTSWLAIGASMLTLLVAGIFLTPLVGLLLYFHSRGRDAEWRAAARQRLAQGAFIVEGDGAGLRPFGGGAHRHRPVDDRTVADLVPGSLVCDSLLSIIRHYRQTIRVFALSYVTYCMIKGKKDWHPTVV